MGLTSNIKDSDWVSVRQAIAKLSSIKLGPTSSPVYAGLTLTGLTASRLLSTNASKVLTSTDLNSWVTGTANQLTVTDDSDGTITLSLPQDIHTGASPTFAGLTVDTNTLIVNATNHNVCINAASYASRDLIVQASANSENSAVFRNMAGTSEGFIIGFDVNGSVNLSLNDENNLFHLRLGFEPGVIIFKERASVTSPAAAEGKIWVKNDTPNNLYFTNDAGTDIKVSHNLTTDIDHASITNTHNLTTDIDHDALTNFASNEHFVQTVIDHVSTTLATGLLKVTTTTGALSVITDSSANWNTAYGWGDHAGLYAAVAHLHNGDTLQCDGVNSDGGAFSFNTTAAVTFNQPISLGTGELTCGSINKAANTLTLEIGGVAKISILDTYIATSVDTYIQSGNLLAGVDDTTVGVITCYGGATGTYGGRLYLNTNADADATIDSYYIRVEADNLHLGDSLNGNVISIIGTGGVSINKSVTLAATCDLTVAGHIIFNTNNSYVGFGDPRITFNDTGNQIEVTGNIVGSNSLSLAEKTAANADVAGYGQVWVKNITPNELWFTDDAGTDHQVAFV